MEQWWGDAEVLMAEQKISFDLFERMLNCSIVELRKDCDKLFSLLEQHQVPLLVFSAGLGDVIVDILKKNNSQNKDIEKRNYKIHSNTHVISNFMDWSLEGKYFLFWVT